ncbi:MAG: hypothetical protein WC242_01780 [Candidatus Paceibacterota bacterium]
MTFKQLSEVTGQRVDLLTVRTTNASVFQNQLVVHLNPDPEVLTTSRERREHGQSDNHEWLKSQIKKVESSSSIAIINVADQDHPLEVVTGDVCVVLVVEGKRYIVSLLRDIWPVGWLSPGGCPRSFIELLNIVAVAEREACEELIIADTDINIYVLDSPQNVARHKEILRILGLYEHKQKFHFLCTAQVRELSPYPGHANRLTIYQGGEQLCDIGNLNLSIDPVTASVAATLYWEIELPIPLSKLRLFDGELLPDGSLLGRPVRLTQKIALAEAPSNDKDEVAALFYRGINVLNTSWLSPTMASRIVDPKQPVLS